MQSQEMNRSSLSLRRCLRLSQRDAIIALAKAKIKDADSYKDHVIMRMQVFAVRHSFAITHRIISLGFRASYARELDRIISEK